MTSSTAETSNVSAHPPRRPAKAASRPRAWGRRGFTLVEMLVVMGIIVAMLAVLLPTVGTAWRKGVRARMMLDLQTIVTGLEAYKMDHNSYPVVYGKGTAPVKNAKGALQSGAVVLGKCMIGPGADDGSDPGANPATDMSPGFRTRLKSTAGIQQGRLYGPYVPPEKFRTGTDFQLLDRNKKPILYYPGRPTANVATTGYLKKVDYGSPAQPMFNGYDNEDSLVTGELQTVLGDHDRDGVIDPPKPPGERSEAPAFTGNYLLWGAGPDEKFGPTGKDTKLPIGPNNRCDDVANFERTEY